MKTRSRSSKSALSLYLTDIAKIPLLSMEEEKALAVRIQSGDEEAINRLVEANLRFVIKVAKKFQMSGVSLMDLIHEGNLGLIEAARRFSPERNVRFLSYAVWWIRQSLFDFLSRYSRIVRISPKAANILSRISKEGRGAETLSREALAEKVGISVTALDKSLTLYSSSVSLDQPVDFDGEILLRDVLAQSGDSSAETAASDKNIQEQLDRCLRMLKPAEQEILRLRFGLNDSTESLTLKEIAERLNRSAERIRQIEAAALRKLRRSLSAQFVSAFTHLPSAASR